jgi:integrase
MHQNASPRGREGGSSTGAKVHSHAPTFAKVLDGRKQPVRGLWQRGARFYAQLSIEDFSAGGKRVRRVPLVNSDGHPVETVPQAVAELNRLRTQRSDDALPKLGRTPTFADYADAYLAGIKAGQGTKKPGTIAKEESTLARWKKHLGGIRLDKIRPAHVAGFMKQRLADEMSKRTVKLDLVALRNVLKQARDVDEHITELPIPPGINRQLKSTSPTRELFTPEDLEKLCQAAMDKEADGTPVAKNGQQFSDYVRLMAYCGARRNETLALRWADVNFQREQLTIGADGDTKNSTSRTLDFNPALKNHLLAMRTRRAPDSQWLFPSPQRGDKEIHAMSFRESLELARAHAKLRRVGFHDMRHLFISFCVMSGIDYMTIAKWVGHRDGGVLIGKVYGHLADTHTRAAAQRVNFGPAILDAASA